jgi:para-aminobenzoate synthetase component 1
MNAADIPNYCFIPATPGATGGTLHILGERTQPRSGAFVIIPYADPQLKKTEPWYYPVNEIITVSGLTGKRVTPGAIHLWQETSRKDYLARVAQLKEHIQRGDIYEINYCVRFSALHCKLDPVSVFFRLNELARAPYAALVRLGDDYILSASPELFLEKKGNTLLSKPIKGTARRGKTPEEDEQLKNQLYMSEKERTENVMAVDVARNDLSQVAKRGTVKVNRLYNIETFETVHQMVSTVSCELRGNSTFGEIINSTFPMASMTGAPKLRAMELIRSVETFDRNFYSGAMGLIDNNGDFSLSVNIRCIFYNERTGEVSIAVGGAITHLSDPREEYEECLLKAGALLRALDATID